MVSNGFGLVVIDRWWRLYSLGCQCLDCLQVLFGEMSSYKLHLVNEFKVILVPAQGDMLVSTPPSPLKCVSSHLPSSMRNNLCAQILFKNLLMPHSKWLHLGAYAWTNQRPCNGLEARDISGKHRPSTFVLGRCNCAEAHVHNKVYHDGVLIAFLNYKATCLPKES